MREIILLACTDCKEAELLNAEKSQEHAGQGRTQEVLSVLPPSYGAQGDEGVGEAVEGRRVESRGQAAGHGLASPVRFGDPGILFQTLNL